MRLLFFLLVLCSCIATYSFGQKQPISLTAYKNWPSVELMAISNNGKYISYIIENQPDGKNTLVIKPINGKWERKIIGAKAARFSNDSKYIHYITPEESSCTISLRTNEEVPFIEERSTKDIAAEPVSVSRSLRDPESMIIYKYNKPYDSILNVSDYFLTVSKTGVFVILKEDSVKIKRIIWYDINTNEKKNIQQCGKNELIEFVHTPATGTNLVFKIVRMGDKSEPNSSVNIWSYRDASDPMPFARINRSNEVYYSTLLNRPDTAFQLAEKYERIHSIGERFAIIEHRIGIDPRESTWNEKARARYYLVSLTNGTRSLLFQETDKGPIQLALSPNNDYVLIADQGKLCYYSYDTHLKESYRLTRDSLISKSYVDVEMCYLDFNIFWMGDNSIILGDDFDLWNLDLSGKQQPISLTNRYGRAHGLTFQMSKVSTENQGNYKFIKKYRDRYLLVAFDLKDKSWGFYLMSLKCENPIKLSMGQYFYGTNPDIVKAGQAEIYLLKRETSKESPNLFFTTDFKDFKQLSSVKPEQEYNWMYSELIRWRAQSGRNCDGILYKPENFDVKKKYPVVVLVYNDFTHMLNKYIDPSQHGFLNFLPTSWLVSNEYLVFVPDVVHRKIGSRLQDSYDIAMSGIKYISTFPYIRPDKIGIQGASWGGEQVNYLITHTNLFAAAFTGAGPTERISLSGYSDMYVSGLPFLPSNEIYFGHGVSEATQLYIQEAALFRSNMVTTPLLLKHNIDDDAVPFYQGLQFFRALRRQGKKVWMLQYKNGGHGVSPGADYDDMSHRISQFFDYYLKDKRPPEWMFGYESIQNGDPQNGFEPNNTGLIP